MDRFDRQVKQRWFRRVLLAGVASIHILLAGNGFGLDPARDLLQYNCQTWGRPNGLPVNGINAIIQTQDGYLWLGTAIGLVRFDGVDFKVLDLGRVPEVKTSSMVNSLSKARDGGFWVGLEYSSFGFCDGQSFSFRGRESWRAVDQDVSYVHSILESKDGTVWLGAQGALLRLTHAGKYDEVFGSSANAITKAGTVDVLCGYEDPERNLWFGTADNGVYCWQSGRITKLPDPDLDGKNVHCVAKDKEGQIWVGTKDGLFCYDTNLVRKDIPPLSAEILALLVDEHGAVWIGTSGQGLACYRNGTYEYLRKIDGLASDYVRCLAEDREGSLWIGTRSGLSQLTDVKFTTQPAAEDPNVKDALAVCASRKGGIWVGSGGGLTYFDGKPRTYGVEAGLTNPYVKRVFEAADGDVYLVSGTKNLVVFSGEKAVANYSAPEMVVGMAEDAHGVVVSVGGSLYRADRNHFAPYAFSNGEPGLYWILNLAPGRDGEIWVASINGLFRVKNGSYQQCGAAAGISDNRMLWVCEDSDGIVWGASLNGIIRLKDNQLRLISRRDGLFDNNIYSIVPDDKGKLWVDSGRGIFEVSRKSMNGFADGKTDQVECVAYDGPESVKPSDKTTQEHVACKTLDGRIWFPTANGVVVIDPAHVLPNRVAPPVQIESVRANGVEMSRSNSLVVAPGRGELEIHFTALSFIAPHNVRLRYQLEGYDKDWVERKDRRLALYTNLKPGRYTFHVIAANADGVWNGRGDSIEIELRPHYYQAAWFDVLCGSLLCAALLGIYAWRVRHLHRKQQELQKARQLLEAEVQSRTAELAKANASLQQEIAGHERTEVELHKRTLSLELEIEERRQMQQEVERVHRELLETSRMAGMSEIATNVLHNVGNVLNSVNISAALVTENVKRSKLGNLAKVTVLLKEHENDLGTFMTRDPKGRQLPCYLAKLSELLQADRTMTLQELDSLRKNIEHINEIVAMQQNYANISGVKEIVNVHSLVEDSLRMNLGAMERHGVKVIRDFQPVPPINIEKHKILQILVNLLRNAKYACDDSGRTDKRLTVRVANGNGRLKISVADNGVGIARENLTRIFNHGFTTRKNGHGFGLHSGALAAKEMGGSLMVHSDGPGKGATFTLELPMPSGMAKS
jgi:ligand-binding sensor domain-containing protein/signal transduction histidine kinase